MSKREFTSLAHLFERLGLGIEPDIRFGGPTLKLSNKTVLFRLDKENLMEAASPAYTASALLMRRFLFQWIHS